MNTHFLAKVNEIVKRDGRYKPDAFEFVMQSLWFTQKKLKREGHVSGKELLEGAREYGLEQYGPMTKHVFLHWGVTKTEDFGEIVFLMIEAGLLGKTEDDTRKDFANGFNFDDALDVFNLKKSIT